MVLTIAEKSFSMPLCFYKMQGVVKSEILLTKLTFLAADTHTRGEYLLEIVKSGGKIQSVPEVSNLGATSRTTQTSLLES